MGPRFGNSLFGYTCAASLLITATAFAADGPSRQDEIEALRQQIAAQKKQIEILQNALAAQQQALDRLAAVPSNQNSAGPLVASTSPTALAGALGTQKPVEAVQATTESKNASPLSFRIGDADFTPGGFLDFTSIFRSTNVGSGIGTAFGSIPYHNTATGRATESRLTAQDSRLSLKVDAKVGRVPITGYVESDFIGNAPGNLHVSSNSNTLRMRLYWVDIRPGNWELLGGQSWSMLTPNRKGISPAPADVFYGLGMDTNYQVGIVWTRAAQFRAVYHSPGGLHVGFALENPEQFTSAAVLPSFATSQFDNGTNTATPNVHPDIQAKIAYDHKTAGGLAMHVEAGGVLRGFRVVGPAPALTRKTYEGGAGTASANLEFLKGLRLVAMGFYGPGGGRYIFGLGPDVIVRPDGSLSPIHAGSGLAGLEYTATKHSTLYAYHGVAYYGRNYSLVSPGTYVGYGFPGSPTTHNRTIQEWTFGYNHTFWSNPRYGTLQLINQYSYVTRAPWSIPATGPARAHTHMLYNDLRFTLP